MTAKEFLRRARACDRLVDEAEERAARVRARLETGRLSSITGMLRGGSGDWTLTADRLMALERRVNARIRELVRWKLQAMEAIARVPGPRFRELLELYYIDCYTWERVAEKMGLSDRQVRRLHGLALLQVEVPEEAEDE